MGARTESGARVAEIEAVYRRDFERFATVAAAIVGSQAGARDAVQDAFAAALRSRRLLRDGAALEGWLWQIVVNEARTQRRRAAARDGVEKRAQAGAPTPAASLGPDQGAVGALVASLPERQRLVVFLRYYADLTYEQIAQAIGVKPGTVAATLASAHNALRVRLEEVAC